MIYFQKQKRLSIGVGAGAAGIGLGGMSAMTPDQQYYS